MPVRWRLTLYIALAIGAILLILGFALFFLLRNALLSNVENTTRQRAENAASSIHEGESLDDDDIEELTLDGVFVIVRVESGGVLTETVDLPKGGRGDPVSRRALDTGEPASGTVQFSGEEPTYVYAVPVEPDEGRARVVEAGKSYEAAQEGIKSLGTILAAGIGAAPVFSIGGAYLLARAALTPVETVTRTAWSMGEEDLFKRLPVANPKAEIGRLATTINALLARLETAFAHREDALSRQRRFAADARVRPSMSAAKTSLRSRKRQSIQPGTTQTAVCRSNLFHQTRGSWVLSTGDVSSRSLSYCSTKPLSTRRKAGL